MRLGSVTVSSAEGEQPSRTLAGEMASRQADARVASRNETRGSYGVDAVTEGPALGASSVPDEPRRAEARPPGVDSRVLRARWRTASLAAGWRFPSDWGLPEVDAVCAAVLTEGPRSEERRGGKGTRDRG